MLKHKIVAIIGTRPEAIKMAPILSLLKKDKNISLVTISTGQHKELLKPIFSLFKIKPDIELDVMKKNQTLVDIQNNVLSKTYNELNKIKPDLLLVQGDTSTVLASSLAAFYLKIPIGHVEAGLRTHDMYNPFPEEANRVLVSNLSSIHFCPTKESKTNLEKENITKNLFITGNTVIDSLLAVSKTIKSKPLSESKKILLTCHRRENFGAPLEAIFEAVLEIAKERKDITFVYPVHPNPNVKRLAQEKLSNVKNIELVEPLDYLDFIRAMKESYLILTDSGGVQEEAPALGKPVLILRENTERPEVIAYGVAKIVGYNKAKIKKEVYKLLDNKEYYKSMVKGRSPYGDGKSAQKIKKIVIDFLDQRKDKLSAK